MHRPAPGRERARAGTKLTVLVLVLLLLGVGVAGAYSWMTGASGPTDPVSLQVPRGATAEEVGSLLEEQGVIRSALAFRVLASFRDIGASLQAGRYELTTNMAIDEVFEALSAGPAPKKEVTFTLPEGLELAEAADHVAEIGLDPDRFRRLAQSGDFALPPYLPPGTETLEGFLYPETYSLPRRIDEKGLVEQLLRQFRTVASDLPWENAQELGLSPYEIVIVASLIEGESKVPEDRAKVSAVIYNRLEQEMPLEIDAAIQYAIPGPNRELTFDDLDYQSPYNVYLNPGLPPTPVTSPGEASLRAALEPADADYLYFLVVDPETGRHGFFETYDEFINKRNSLPFYD